MITIEQEVWGMTAEGEGIIRYTMRNELGASVQLSNYGATILSVVVPDREGKLADVCLGYKNPEGYFFDGPDLGKVYEPYTLFKAYREGNVYGCNSAELIFYEETPFHPERLLHDYIKILHPTLLPDDTLRYFHRLND